MICTTRILTEEEKELYDLYVMKYPLPKFMDDIDIPKLPKMTKRTYHFKMVDGKLRLKVVESDNSVAQRISDAK